MSANAKTLIHLYILITISTHSIRSVIMPNIGAALTSGTIIGGIVFMIALWAYEEYQRVQRRERRQAYEDNRTPPAGSRVVAPPQPASDCSICRDGLTSPLEILPCGHIFHRQCIKKWFERRMICPVCRLRIADEVADEYGRRLGL